MKKIIIGTLATLLVAGTIAFATVSTNDNKADCCYKESPCCQTGNPCCQK